jgi:hypothetical protein
MYHSRLIRATIAYKGSARPQVSYIELRCRTYHCKVDQVELRQPQQRQRVEDAGQVQLQHSAGTGSGRTGELVVSSKQRMRIKDAGQVQLQQSTGTGSIKKGELVVSSKQRQRIEEAGQVQLHRNSNSQQHIRS